MKPTIALCQFVNNDLPWLRSTLPYDMRWADQVCILDMGSTDGTQEYCKAFLRPNDVYVRREENTCPELGFDEAKNAVADLATTDWIYFSAADQVLMPDQASLIHSICEEAKTPVLTVRCINLESSPAIEPETWEQTFFQGKCKSREEFHPRLIRRDAGVIVRGYIHEEPHIGEVNSIKFATWTNLQMLHFQSTANAEIRRMRYSWMFQRAIDNPELQKYTNAWWYDVYCPSVAADIKEWAMKYEKHVAEMGQK